MIAPYKEDFKQITKKNSAEFGENIDKDANALLAKNPQLKVILPKLMQINKPFWDIKRQFKHDRELAIWAISIFLSHLTISSIKNSQEITNPYNKDAWMKITLASTDKGIVQLHEAMMRANSLFSEKYNIWNEVIRSAEMRTPRHLNGKELIKFKRRAITKSHRHITSELFNIYRRSKEKFISAKKTNTLNKDDVVGLLENILKEASKEKEELLLTSLENLESKYDATYINLKKYKLNIDKNNAINILLQLESAIDLMIRTERNIDILDQVPDCIEPVFHFEKVITPLFDIQLLDIIGEGAGAAPEFFELIAKAAINKLIDEKYGSFVSSRNSRP